MKLYPLKDLLFKELQDSQFALEFLASACEDNDLEGFLHALRAVIEARGGVGKLSGKCKKLHRVSLYKALSEDGNPLMSSMFEILDALGIGLKPYYKNEKALRK